MRFPLLGRWEEAEAGVVLVERLYVARTFWQRCRGLQFARPLEPNCGLMLCNCKSIHTMWMRFAIDLVFLSEDYRVLEIRTGVKPWRFVIPQEKQVAHVIEVTSGQQADLSVGKRTRIKQSSESPVSERRKEFESSSTSKRKTTEDHSPYTHTACIYNTESV